MTTEFSPQYNPVETEDKIYKIWEESGYFDPDKLPGKRQKTFCLIMPPPNANGSLHVGHAVGAAVQDLIIRYRRMKGDKVLLLPGADHAGFETQVVYNKKIEKEGRSVWEISRKKQYQEILAFTLANKKKMEDQMRRLGLSCDWSREKFTLDEDIKKIVYKTFFDLYKDGLIYKAKKPVNWCIKHQTTLSNLECKHEKRQNKLYFIKYKIQNSDNYIEVATTRPETIPADIALAVHPKSKWKKYKGKKVLNPLNGKYLPIITDSSVSLDFGTGALKITPLHDSLDFKIYTKHLKEIPDQAISVIDQKGRMTVEAGPDLEGLKVAEARGKAAEMLKEYYAKPPEDYQNEVTVCYKCNSLVEPLPIPQFWLKMSERPKSKKKSLRDAALQAVKDDKIIFIPAQFKKIFLNWVKNLEDWNISRQIAWGIRIPVWYCQNCGIILSEKELNDCPDCNGKVKQEEDVFDTWFSSGQWPFATLKTTKELDFEIFYPTSVMETASDILLFWVTRMVMLGLYETGRIPFEKVYLHGLVRDIEKKKMSKSKGNVVDPLGIIDSYGTDALRISLIVGNTPGKDQSISEEKIRGYRNFANKIWNVSRFVLKNFPVDSAKPKYNQEDEKTFKELSVLIKNVSKDIDTFKFYLGAEKLYHYLWHIFADKIIESLKPRLSSENKEDKLAAQCLLAEILTVLLKLLHPFMPFITEEIWSFLPNREKLLIIESWPE